MDYTILHEKLKNQFGHNDYKNDMQKEATEAIFKGDKDVYICMPSGFGKSLCFQLPVIAKNNSFAIVISPTIVHAKSQVDYLRSKNVLAYNWNAYTPKNIRTYIKNDIVSSKPKMKMLYVTPEQFRTLHFQVKLMERKSNTLLYIVIDEAHCLSRQSHDFRHIYENLIWLKQKLPTVPIVAITSTATKKVREDILRLLEMKNPLTFSMPVFRPNLYYDMWFKDILPDPETHLKEFIVKCLDLNDDSITKEKRDCGIIFCENQEAIAKLAKALKDRGIQTSSYNNHLKIKDRLEIQHLWNTGEIRIMLATNSFGIGIDKHAVRFVVHWGSPRSFGSYYQESGRAGHDDNVSHCRIYCNFEEVNTELSTLKCRHAIFSKYFGDPKPICKTLCDNCKNEEDVKERILQLNMYNAKNKALHERSSTMFDVNNVEINVESNENFCQRRKILQILITRCDELVKNKVIKQSDSQNKNQNTSKNSKFGYANLKETVYGSKNNSSNDKDVICIDKQSKKYDAQNKTAENSKYSYSNLETWKRSVSNQNKNHNTSKSTKPTEKYPIEKKTNKNVKYSHSNVRTYGSSDKTFHKVRLDPQLDSIIRGIYESSIEHNVTTKSYYQNKNQNTSKSTKLASANLKVHKNLNKTVYGTTNNSSNDKRVIYIEKQTEKYPIKKKTDKNVKYSYSNLKTHESSDKTFCDVINISDDENIICLDEQRTTEKYSIKRKIDKNVKYSPSNVKTCESLNDSSCDIVVIDSSGDESIICIEEQSEKYDNCNQNKTVQNDQCIALNEKEQSLRKILNDKQRLQSREYEIQHKTYQSIKKRLFSELELENLDPNKKRKN